MKATKISVGLSGGVDSSVTALLLKDHPHLDAFFMKNWESDDEHCSSEDDFKSAQAVANQLGLELHAVNFSQAYWDDVFQVCLDQMTLGLTPNPDILCNEKIKFTLFLNHALKSGADKIATGHYANLSAGKHGYELRQAKDRFKDQTYFLYRLNQMQLANVTFPLGQLSKQEVRQIAQKAGLPSASRPDSTGICFIGEQHYARFIRTFLLGNPGAITTESGMEIGQHDGLAPYTVGQRKGLAIGGVKGANASPWYVIGKDLDHNQLIVTQCRDHPALQSKKLTAQNIHWISGKAPSNPANLTVKIRHGESQTSAVINQLDSESFTVELKNQVWAPCKGQSLVLYDGDLCLGGGMLSCYEGALF